MCYYVRLICKVSVYKLFSELFLATSCLLYADTRIVSRAIRIFHVLTIERARRTVERGPGRGGKRLRRALNSQYVKNADGSRD